MTNKPWIGAVALLLALLTFVGPIGYTSYVLSFPAEQPPVPLNEAIPEPEPFRAEDPDPLPEQTQLQLMLDGESSDLPVWLHEGRYYVRVDAVARLFGASVKMTQQEAVFKGPAGKVRLVRDMPNFFCGSRICSWYGQEPLMSESGMLVSVESISRALNMGYLEDTEQQTLYLTSVAGGFSIPAGVSVPVLMYHCISDEITGDGVLYVSPENMEAQLKYLTENGYTTIFLHELADADLYEKPVILTVDDGYLDNYTQLFPLLQKYNCKATIFVVTDLVDKADHKMTSQQLRELANSGLVSIQSHTASHPRLRNLSRASQQEELLRSRLAVTRITGRVPYALCYPYGQYNRDTLDLVQAYYGIGLQIGNADFLTGTDRRCISRWYVKRATTMEEFIEMVDTQQKDEIK